MLYHKNLLLSISFSEIGLGASEIALDWCKREGHCHKKIKHTKPRYPLGPFGLWCISTLHSRSFHLLIGSFSETSKTVCFHFVCPPFCEWLIRTRNPHGLKALAMCQWISKIWGAFELQSKNKESSPFCIESILGNLFFKKKQIPFPIEFQCNLAGLQKLRGQHLPKDLDSDENFKPQYSLFCRDIKICRDLRTF